MPSKKYPWEDYEITTAMDRQYAGYPPPKYWALLEIYREANEMGKSEMLNFVIRHFFDNIPATEIERLKSVAALNKSRSSPAV